MEFIIALPRSLAKVLLYLGDCGYIEKLAYFILVKVNYDTKKLTIIYLSKKFSFMVCTLFLFQVGVLSLHYIF